MGGYGSNGGNGGNGGNFGHNGAGKVLATSRGVCEKRAMVRGVCT